MDKIQRVRWTKAECDKCISIIKRNYGNMKLAYELCSTATGRNIGSIHKSYYNPTGAIRKRIEETNAVLFFTVVGGEKFVNKKNVQKRYLEKNKD